LSVLYRIIRHGTSTVNVYCKVYLLTSPKFLLDTNAIHGFLKGQASIAQAFSNTKPIVTKILIGIRQHKTPPLPAADCPEPDAPSMG
jgi:hypothetical protein